MAVEEQLLAITPIDGRYADKVAELSPIVSEFGLIKYRVAIEVGWLTTLGSGVLPDEEPFSDAEVDAITQIPYDFSLDDAMDVKEIEGVTRHDVNAVVEWLKTKLRIVSPNVRPDLAHLTLTSEDINNLAFAMMVRDAGLVIGGETGKIATDLNGKALEYADLSMLARTHGQPATPTTVGKEFAVFGDRLTQHEARLGAISIFGKFNGATGNYAAAHIAYPEVNWPLVNKEFVESLGFEFNPTTTQIEPHDWMAAYFNELSVGNNVMTDLAQDMWLYIMNGVFKQKVIAGEVGSSTMPHKVNPIDFENAEANFGIANSGAGYLSGKLTKSRLQRDLSDSSAQRAMSEAFGHTLVALKSLKRGLGKISPDEEKIAAELDGNWSVLTEAVQTVMRRYGIADAYDIIKQASRGRELNEAGYVRLVATLDIPAEAKKRLLDLTPADYVGYAPQIARAEV